MGKGDKTLKHQRLKKHRIMCVCVCVFFYSVFLVFWLAWVFSLGFEEQALGAWPVQLQLIEEQSGAA